MFCNGYVSYMVHSSIEAQQTSVKVFTSILERAYAISNLLMNIYNFSQRLGVVSKLYLNMTHEQGMVLKNSKCS